jgi:PAS domain S-box-containing protein
VRPDEYSATLAGAGNFEAMTHHEPNVDVTHALEEVTLPACVVDRQGKVRWQNRGLIELVGDRLGQPVTRMVAPEDLQIARTHFAKKMLGEAETTDYELTVLRRDGRRLRVRVSSVPLMKDGEVVGVFGMSYPLDVTADGDGDAPPPAEAPELTARQYETLTLLWEGLGTEEIASRLGVADETARNHIRGLLRELGVHSRLEAVVRGYMLGLLPPSGD